MISSALRAKHPALAERLRDTSIDTLRDPLGEPFIRLANDCLDASYDVGKLYLQAIQAKSRAARPERFDVLLDNLLKLIRADAAQVPPKGLEDAMGLVSPALAFAGRAA